MNTKYEIVVLKLTSGEELVARVIADEMMRFVVMHPLSIVPGNNGVGLMPSIFTADEDKEVVINKNNITMTATPREEVRIKYIEMISNIVVPEKKIIMG